jgi:putative Holliday junction resolvase
MAETLLAFDYGVRRVGVAVGESLVGSARALKPLVFASKVPTAQLLDAISALVDEWQPEKFVVGWPRHPDGAANEMTARCEKFSRQLAARFRRPVELVDERYSSVDARARLREQCMKKSQTEGALDSEAAAVLLERYFESHPRR